MIWMAVTADEYELPLAQADTLKQLNEMLGLGKGTIYCMRARGIKTSQKSFAGERYRIVKVEEQDE